MADDRNIELRVSATDDASKVIDKVADKIEGLDEAAEIEVTADTGDALSDIEKLERTLDGVTSDRGREVLIEFRAQKLESEIKRAVRALDTLEDPVEIEVKTAELDRAEADLEDLKRLANDKYEIDVKVTGGSTKRLDDIKRKTDDIGESGRAGSTAIGGIGGSVSELPGVGSLGPIAESLGQLTENALEGGESLKSLAGAGVILGTTALAMYGISRGAKQAADRTEDLTESIEDLSTASDELFAITAAEAWVRMFERAAFDGQNLQDQVDALAESNLVGAKRMLDNADAIGLNAEARNMLRVAIEKVEAAEAQATRTEEQYGSKTDEAAEASAALAEQQARVAEQTERAAAALQAQADLLTGQAEAMRAAADADFAYVLAVNDLEEAVTKSDEVLADSTSTANEIEEALIGVATASGDVADAAVRQAEEQAAANGETLSASAATAIWNKNMLASASTMKGPQRRAVLDYIASVNGIPPEKVTEIEALLDEGKIAEAETLLNETSRKRETEIEAEALTDDAEAKLAELERARSMRLTATFHPQLPPGWRFNGNGDIVTPGGGVIRSAPLPPSEPATLPAAVGATNVTINLPRSAAGPDVVKHVNRWARVNGGGHLARAPRRGR